MVKMKVIDKRGLAFFLLTLCLLGGCRKEHKKEATKAATTDQNDQADPSADQREQARAEVASEADVRGVVQRWLVAQNKADFAAYEQLYAQRFTGKKLANGRATEYGRVGWLADRKALFEKPFTVTARNINVGFSSENAMVQFEQTWSNDAFSDKGTKFLIVVREHGKLLIAREEMVSSQDTKGGLSSRLSFEKAALARSALGKTMLLIEGPVKVNWALEHPIYASDNLALRAVAPQALPTSVRAHREREYEVFDRLGNRCNAKGAGFQLVVQVIPHFGVIQTWNGGFDNLPPASHEHRALELWKMAVARGGLFDETTTPGLQLGLEIEVDGPCETPLWGRVKTEESAALWASRAATQNELLMLTRSVRLHPEVVEREKVFARGQVGAQSKETWFLQLAEGGAHIFEGKYGEKLLYATAQGRTFECDSGAVGLLWRQKGDGLAPITGRYDESILSVADLDGDGEAELVSMQSILKKEGLRYREVVSGEPLFLDCGC